MRKAVLSVLLLGGIALAPAALHAQAAVEGRVQRLEGEMRAVQRKVFPGGGGQYVEPDNSPAPAQDLLPSQAPSAVADLATRIDSLEGQLRTLTGQVETNQYRTQQLETRIKALEANAAATPAAAAPTPDAAPVRPAPRPAAPSAARPSDRMGDDPVVARDHPANRAADRAADKPAPRTADPARTARVTEVERPETGDTAEDTYLYGYRLWAARLYPEAEAQFLAVTTKFPAHKRASYAQNLLGRSYLDDGKPSLASLAFLDNYKKWPDGDRAPESLMYLAQALVTLNKPPAQVCKVYTELQRSYGTKVDADAKMKAAVAKGRAASSCS